MHKRSHLTLQVGPWLDVSCPVESWNSAILHLSWPGIVVSDFRAFGFVLPAFTPSSSMCFTSVFARERWR